MLKIFIPALLLLPALTSNCQGTAAANSKNSVVRLTKEAEPGKPFTLEIKVLDIDTRQPVKDAEVFAYQTNHVGDYERDSKGVARIHGTAFSDEKGAIKFYTIYPRGYNNSPSGEHIHFVVQGKGYKKEDKELIFSDYYQKRYDTKNPKTHTIYLESLDEKDGKMHGLATMYMKKG